MRDDLRVRHIVDTDWDAITELERRAYTGRGLSEGRAALESRCRASPATCLVVSTPDRLAGYSLALPYPMFTVPELSAREESAFTSPNLHLHDLVIADDFRGTGLATTLLHHLTATARSREHRCMSLVAVAATAAFWSAHGFRACREVAVPSSYGANAVYMSKELPTSTC